MISFLFGCWSFNLSSFTLINASTLPQTLVREDGVEPPTRGSSVPCSTNWATPANKFPYCQRPLSWCGRRESNPYTISDTWLWTKRGYHYTTSAFCTGNGIRTRVTCLKGTSPRPLADIPAYILCTWRDSNPWFRVRTYAYHFICFQNGLETNVLPSCPVRQPHLNFRHILHYKDTTFFWQFQIFLNKVQLIHLYLSHDESIA